MGRKIVELSVFFDRETSHPCRTLCMSCHGGGGDENRVRAKFCSLHSEKSVAFGVVNRSG